MTDRPIDDDDAWDEWRSQWRLRADTLYLNHGSFGPPPLPVRDCRREWQERLDSQPMDFFVRAFEPAWLEARERLAAFLDTSAGNLVFVENATAAMNVVAGSLPLAVGDEVLLTDHEYGAVKRIWERRCRRAGAKQIVARLPLPLESPAQAVEAIFAAVTPRTRLIVVSHITSPTAIILPVADVCRRARQAGIAVCIDGPHAPAQASVDLDLLDCDFYCASLHKWLSAPFGSGFLYVHPRQQGKIEAAHLSWGRVWPHQPQSWDDEFIWTGTRDPSPYLAVPAAIDFLESVGLAAFRARTHYLASVARAALADLGRDPIVSADDAWFGSMVLVPLPPGEALPLQTALWQRFGIEVPIIDFADRRFVRVSCHLYNRACDIERLSLALRDCLQG